MSTFNNRLSLPVIASHARLASPPRERRDAQPAPPDSSGMKLAIQESIEQAFGANSREHQPDSDDLLYQFRMQL